MEIPSRKSDSRPYSLHALLEDFPELQQLDRLNIDFNNIRRLDEWLLVLKFPNLKTIDFRRNLFNCDRLKAIINLMYSKQIGYNSDKETGDNLMEKLKGIYCRELNIPTAENVEERMTDLELERLNGTVALSTCCDQMFAYNMAFVAFVILDLIFFVCFFFLGINFVRKHQIQRV